MNTKIASSHQAEVDHFYELLKGRIASIGSRYGHRLPTARDLPTTRTGWHTKGVYFFFEDGEHRMSEGAQRVVRVGSHSGPKSTIESRIVREHSKDWGRSIFRRHLGTALIRKGVFDPAINQTDRDRWVQRWCGKCNIRKRDVHGNPKLLDPTLHPLHSLVTRAIENMTIVWVEIADTEERLELERQCIGLLSNYSRCDAPIDQPSASWLGHHALAEEVRRSGMWNVTHVKTPHTPGFLDHFRQYFEL